MKLLLKSAGIFCISSWEQLNKSDIHFNGICYIENNIIIGENSFLNYLNKSKIDHVSEGRFTAAYPTDEQYNNWIIKTDESGQGLIFYFNDGKNWAASNSFLYLAQFLKKKCIKLTFNIKAILGINAFHSTTEQLVSHSTAIKEINLLPYNKFIRISDNEIFLEKTKNIIPDNYEEGMVDFRNVWASRLNALNDHFENNISCDLTGGYDSRTVFGLLLSSETNLSNMWIRSNRLQEDDFRVANKLAENYNIKLNNGSFKHKISYSNEQAFELWKYGNLGIYFPVYFAINDYIQTTNIQLHGAGGEGLRGTVDNSTANQIANRLANKVTKKFSKELIDSFKQEFINGAKEAGFDKNEGLDHKYYNFYRSRMHFGRNQFRSLYSNLITPLTSARLHSLKNIVPEGSVNTQVYSDLMLLCDKKLPTFDFDDVGRNFTKEQIIGSKFYKNSNKTEIRSINVYADDFTPNNTIVENKQSSNEILCSELKDWEYFLIYSNIIDKSEFEILIKEILIGKNLTKNLKMASYLLSVAEIKSLCTE